jgi:hypothetical protein
MKEPKNDVCVCLQRVCARGVSVSESVSVSVSVCKRRRPKIPQFDLGGCDEN